MIWKWVALDSWKLYELYERDPLLVDPSWAEEFSRIKVHSPNKREISHSDAFTSVPEEASLQDPRILRLIEAYRSFSWLKAATNPLYENPVKAPWQLDLQHLGFTEADLDGLFISPLSGRIAPLKQIHPHSHSAKNA